MIGRRIQLNINKKVHTIMQIAGSQCSNLFLYNFLVLGSDWGNRIAGDCTEVVPICSRKVVPSQLLAKLGRYLTEAAEGVAAAGPYVILSCLV